jgi:hypothetical protein
MFDVTSNWPPPRLVGSKWQTDRQTRKQLFVSSSCKGQAYDIATAYVTNRLKPTLTFCTSSIVHYGAAQRLAGGPTHGVSSTTSPTGWR